MAITLSRTKEIFARLEKEGKFQVMDSPEFLQMMADINKRMEEYRRELRIKSANSRIAASQFIITS